MGQGEALALVGTDAATLELRDRVENATRSDAHVLLEGEGGVGQEFVARLIHQGSLRRGRAFVTIECLKISQPQLEARLFGGWGGAEGTEAVTAAHGGTLFLDSIDGLSLHTQVRLMRWLETGEVQSASSQGRQRAVNVRIICSTRARLSHAATAGTFRSDLYALLSQVIIDVPRLRRQRAGANPTLRHASTDATSPRAAGGLTPARAAEFDRSPWSSGDRADPAADHIVYAIDSR
jgi:two-component system response regulator HydG